MESVVVPWGEWRLHGECGGSMGSVVALWRLNVECGGSMGRVAAQECGGSMGSVSAP